MPPISITTPETVQRQWGAETTLVRTGTHCGKMLYRRAGTKGGFQFHLKEESHYLLSGLLKIRTASGEQIVTEGSAWTVPPFTVHQEEALKDSVIIEISDPTTDDRVSLEPDPGGLPSLTKAKAAHIADELAEGLLRRGNYYREVMHAIGDVADIKELANG